MKGQSKNNKIAGKYFFREFLKMAAVVPAYNTSPGVLTVEQLVASDWFRYLRHEEKQ